MKIYQLFFILFLSCNKNEEKQTYFDHKSDSKVSSGKALSHEKVTNDLNNEIITLLKNKKYKDLSAFIHPEKGIKFSMYSFVSDEDKSFSKSDFEKYINADEKFTFGHTDGSGAIYIVTLKDYLKDWVFKKDFSTAKINYDNFEGKGNSLNNIKEKYPNSETVENYLAGTVEYSYMDWNSLILIFEKIDNQYYLVAIANNQWTV